jgi:hypothetical protein
MKIRGITPSKRGNEFLVIPRPEQDIPFEAKPIEDFDEFNALVKPPAPPAKLGKSGQKELDLDNVGYRQQLEAYNQMELDYMVVKSLEPSAIEWTKVNIETPKTWRLWKEEFSEAGFTLAEINAIFKLVMDANTLDEAKMKAAREAFIRGQVKTQAPSSGPSTENQSTPSGEPVVA